MAKKSIHLLCLFVAFALSANASAALLVYEGFDYPADGTIGGNDGGFGWDQPWTGSNTVLSPGLDYVELPVVGNTGAITGHDDPSFRMMPSYFNALNRTIWISFLAQEMSAASYAGFSTFDGDIESMFLGSVWDTNPPRYWGIRVYNALNDSGVEEGPVFVSTIETTEKVFFVARIINGPSSAQMTLWLNPGLETVPENDDAWFDAEVGRVPFDRIRLNCWADDGDTVRYDFDEIRIGESYADVIMAPSVAKTATNPRPGDRQTDVSPEVVLTWRPGMYVAGLSPKHKVFFSENFNDVASGIGGVEQDEERYPVGGTLSLDLGKTYYWRVDEANSTTGWDVGSVWRFEVANYIVVDDFEGYDTGENQIWFSWKEGIGYTDPETYCGNGTGSAVGDETTASYTEETIVHGGDQAMPYTYINDGTSTNICGDPIVEYYSEAELTFSSPQDWTREGVRALSLWFSGYPEYLGSFSEGPPGTYTMTGEGEDIWGQLDEFHFAWKELSGAGSITAKVESVENTDGWAKAGVMIRDTLDADSTHAMVAITPANGVWFGRRTMAGGNTDSDSQDGVAAPYWVRLERTVGGMMRAYHSPDGSTWTQLGTSVGIDMSMPMHIGLAVTSRNSGVACEGVFSNIISDGTGERVNEDIGMARNESEPMYVAISDTDGTAGFVYQTDPNAMFTETWKEWNIELEEFADQDVDLTDVNSFAIGFGDPDDPQAGGSGKMYFDDIRLYQPRCVPDKLTLSEADLNSDCVVDCLDLEMMTNDWLQGDHVIAATTPEEPAISWWEFEDNVDDSVGANHGIMYGDPTFVVGKFGQAISLDGDDYVDCGNSSTLDFGTDDWTISAWIKTTQSGSTDEGKGTVFAKGGDEAGGIRYTLALNETSSGNITLTTDDNVTKAQATGSISVNDGEWHHVTGMRIGDKLRVYVDAVSDGIKDLPAGYDLSGTSQHNALLGAITDNRDSSLFKHFVGSIDDVQIYSFALRYSDIIGAAGLTEVYYPLTSPANIFDQEPNKSKKVNLKDFSILADDWLEQQLLWPEQ